MKLLAESFFISLSMYSILPVKNLIWNEKNMRYALAFFPLVGVIEGFLVYLVYNICIALGISNILFSAIAVLTMVYITGGIHLDGFCDTADALFSRRDMEKKLQILKDPNCGPFAVFSVIIVFLIMTASLSEIYLKENPLLVKSLIFVMVISRILNAFSITSFKCTSTSSLAKTFGENAGKNVRYILIAELIAALIILIFYSYRLSLMYIVVSSVVFFLFYRMQKKQFGGLTGDLAGFFLVINETVLALFTAIFGGAVV